MSEPISFDSQTPSFLPQEPKESLPELPFCPTAIPIDTAQPLHPSRVQQQISQGNPQSQTAGKTHGIFTKTVVGQSSEEDSMYSLDEATVLENLKKEIPDLDRSSLDDKKLLILGLLLHRAHMDADAFATSPEEQLTMYAKNREIIKTTNLDRISVSLSTKEIMKIYNEYGVIQLRPLVGDSLLLGCGHSCHQHTHSEDVDTLDIRISNNPSICTEYGNKKYLRFFQDKCSYNQILDEGPILAITLSPCQTPSEKQTALDDFFDCVRSSLKPKGLLALPERPFIHYKGTITLDMIPVDFKKEDDLPQQQQESVMNSFWFRYTPLEGG